jgi:hypothetical protein
MWQKKGMFPLSLAICSLLICFYPIVNGKSMLALPQLLLLFPKGLGNPLFKASSGQAPDDRPPHSSVKNNFPFQRWERESMIMASSVSY